ncbi:MAG: AarF/ABC1/UbiB kinase family protein [Verrucomicrobia bacterium]|nr:AarF/ABC1/UbiB kinase family protein [Verrucomicrobiota bacterium]
MKITAGHLKRYHQIARLLWKYGRSDLVKEMDLPAEETGVTEQTVREDGAPEQLADDLEAMGPTFIKLGQVLAGRPDLLPEAYTAALARLQDSVKPFPYADVEQIVMNELGVRISKAFSYFNAEPLAAASLGQVHVAALRDGRPVVVKVQRPGIRRQIAEDFDVLEEIAQFLDAHTEAGRRYRFANVLAEFRTTIQQELNYELEANNLVTVGENLKEFELIQIPQPVADYSTRSVLTMDYVKGRKITKLGPLARLEIDSDPLIEQLFKAYLKQVIIDGLFHADPHPGNVFLTDDGRIALLDLGMVGHTAPNMQENLLKLLLAVSEGQSDVAAEIVIHLSEKRAEPDLADFRRRVAQVLVQTKDASLQQMKVGGSLIAMNRAASQCGLYVPSELALLGKTLLQLDEVGLTLNPDFDPNAAIRRNATELMSRRVAHSAAQGGTLRSLLEMKHFMGALPTRLNHIMDAVTEGGIEVKVKAVDAKMVVDGMHKIANRITAGVILAALIIGASLLMRIQTSFQIFGYPGLAILCFLAAAAGGFWLVLTIFFHDDKVLRKPPR